MSGAFRAIGKVFKGIVKVVKKVALPALAIGAIVLTGGAAIGALPAIGSVLGSIGISGGLASALGGAISAGGISAAVGGLGAAISGRNVLKGMSSGFLSGAITGGLMGAAGMISPNGILSDFGVGSAASHAAGLKAAAGSTALSTGIATPVAQAAGKGLLPAAAGTAGVGSANAPFMVGQTGGLLGPTVTAPAAAPSYAGAQSAFGAASPTVGGKVATTAGSGLTAGAAPAGATATSQQPSFFQQALMGPMGGGLLGNQGLLGSILGGIGQGLSEGEALEAAQERDQAQRDYYTRNYGVDPRTGTLAGLLANYSDRPAPSFQSEPPRMNFRSPGRFEYDPQQRRVVFVPAQQGG